MSGGGQKRRNTPDSEFGHVTGPGVFRIERELPGPIERVWTYLTHAEKRRKWFGDGPMQLRSDGRVELQFRFSELTSEQTPANEQDSCAIVGRVTRCDPPRLLSFTWGEEPDASEVTFELTPRGEKVLLVITHRRLPDRETMVRVAAGWHTHIELLSDCFAGGPLHPFWSTKSLLQQKYRSRLRA